MKSTWQTPYKFNGKPACRCTGHRAPACRFTYTRHADRAGRAGRELDSETGLYYYGARYYSPELGIWGSVDPLADKYPSMSAFMYCAGNPVVLVDPDGMDIETTITRYKTMKDGTERKLNAISFRRADRIEITHTVKSMKMFDATGKVSYDEINSAAGQIQNEITDYWNTNGEITNKRGQKLNVTTVFENDIEVVQDRNQISYKDHVIAIASESWIKNHKGGSGEQMTTGGAGGNILYISSWWLGVTGGFYAHEFGHLGGLYDVMFMRGEIHKHRIMYNGNPIFRGMLPAPPPLTPLPKPHYNEFRRLTFRASYRHSLPIGIY